MITLEISTNKGFFKFNGVDYPKGHFALKYDGDLTDNTTSGRNFTIHNIFDKKKLITSRHYSEVTGVNSWDELSVLVETLEILRQDLNSDSAKLDVSIQDQHSQIIDLKLSRKLDDITILNNYNIGDTIIVIETTGIVPVIANTICLKESLAFYQGRPITVTLIAGNQYTIELDTPLDFAFTTSSGCALTDTNLAVDGSVTPIIFSISPANLTAGTSWDITRLILLFGGQGIGVTNENPDDSDFGVASAITKGIVLRSVNGITKNIFNAKTNGDFRARAYDVAYIDASKAGLYSVGIRRSFSGVDKNGVTIRLDSDTSDTFELIVQDDLTEMSGGQCVVQGHVVED